MPGRCLPHRFALILILTPLCTPLPAATQGTLADYARANSLGERLQGLVVDIAERPSWIGETTRFWYRKTVEGGHNFLLVDAETQAKGPAFDHERLASTIAALPAFAEDTISALDLPFNQVTFTDDEQAIEFVAADLTWQCDLDTYECESQGAPERRGRGGGVGPSGVSWSAGPGQLWRNLSTEPILSPDSTHEVFIQNYNVAFREVGADPGDYTMLTWEGTPETPTPTGPSSGRRTPERWRCTGWCPVRRGRCTTSNPHPRTSSSPRIRPSSTRSPEIGSTRRSR